MLLKHSQQCIGWFIHSDRLFLLKYIKLIKEVIRDFQLVMSLSAMSLDHRLCTSRKGRTGGGAGVGFTDNILGLAVEFQSPYGTGMGHFLLHWLKGSPLIL